MSGTPPASPSRGDAPSSSTESPSVFTEIQRGTIAMSRYATDRYDMSQKWPLHKVFPEHIREAMKQEANALRTNAAGIGTALINAASASTGITFVRGVGGMLARPQNFDITFAETGSGKSAALEFSELLLGNIHRVLLEVAPFCNLTDEEIDAAGPFSPIDAKFFAGLSFDLTRVPYIVKAQTVQAITTSLLGKGSTQSPPKKQKTRDSDNSTGEIEQHKNIVVIFDEANAFEAGIMSHKNSVAQIETLCNTPDTFAAATKDDTHSYSDYPTCNFLVAAHGPFVTRVNFDPNMVCTGFPARMQFTNVSMRSPAANALSAFGSNWPFASHLLATFIGHNVDTGLHSVAPSGSVTPQSFASCTSGSGLNNKLVNSIELRRVGPPEEHIVFQSNIDSGETGIALKRGANGFVESGPNSNLSLVGAVKQDGPAELSGVNDDHVVTAINGIEVRFASELLNLVKSFHAFDGGADRIVAPQESEVLPPVGVREDKSYWEWDFVVDVPDPGSILYAGKSNRQFLEVEVTDSGELPEGGTFSDFSGDQARPRPGIILLDVQDDSAFYKAKLPNGSELVAFRKAHDSAGCSAFNEPKLLKFMNQDGKINGNASTLRALSEDNALVGLTMQFLPPNPGLTLTVAPKTAEFMCMEGMYDSLSNLNNELGSRKNNGEVWVTGVRAACPKLQAQVLKNAGGLHALRRGDEILRHAAAMYPGHVWPHKEATAKEFLLLSKATADIRMAKGQDAVKALAGTRKEHNAPRCMTSYLAPCDVHGAVALGEFHLKQKLAILVDSTMDEKIMSPVQSVHERRQAILTDPAISSVLERVGVEDDGQSPNFIKKLLSTAGSPLEPKDGILEATDTPNAASTTTSSGSPRATTQACGVVVSLAYFKEKWKNKDVTKMAACSNSMRIALLKLQSKGYVRQVHCHQTGTSPTSKMYFVELFNPDLLSASDRAKFMKLLQIIGMSLPEYVSARKQTEPVASSGAAASTLQAYKKFRWPGNCCFPNHPVAFGCENWECAKRQCTQPSISEVPGDE